MVLVVKSDKSIHQKTKGAGDRRCVGGGGLTLRILRAVPVYLCSVSLTSKTTLLLVDWDDMPGSGHCRQRRQDLCICFAGPRT